MVACHHYMPGIAMISTILFRRRRQRSTDAVVTLLTQLVC